MSTSKNTQEFINNDENNFPNNDEFTIYEKEASKIKEEVNQIFKERSNIVGHLDLPLEKFSNLTMMMTNEEKSEADARSVFIRNVSFLVIEEELEDHFESCGIVRRCTIPRDVNGYPKSFAYLEFTTLEARNKALLMSGTWLKGVLIQVVPKRTNIHRFVSQSFMSQSLPLYGRVSRGSAYHNNGYNRMVGSNTRGRFETRGQRKYAPY